MIAVDYILGAAIPASTIFGIWIGRRQADPPSDRQLASFMNRIVNQEEIEHQQRVNKFRMARNGLKSQRFDSGPNAQIHKLKVRHVSRRFRNQK